MIKATHFLFLHLTRRSTWILFLLLFTLSSSCSNAPQCDCTFVVPGRRPQVMTGSLDCVLDYGAALVDYQSHLENKACDEEEKEKLQPEPNDLYDPPVKQFYLSKGDILEVYVYGEEESHFQDLVIAPDGCIYYAFLDGILASQRTLEEVSQDLEKALEQYYKHPRVTLNLQASSSMNWKIFGKVQKTGVYPLQGPLTLRQAIGVAGGLAVENYEFKTSNSDLEVLADLKHSFLIRDNKKLDINFKKLIHNADERYDIFIKPGDYIYIASTPYREVYVLGNVRGPARVQYLDEMTLMQAIAESGGWPIGGPFAADVTNCLVIRGDLENPCVIRCDLCLLARGEAKDFYLVPGDIIYIHNKTLRFARSLVTLAINTFIQSFATTAGSYYADNVWFHVAIPDTSTSGD